MRTSEPDDYGDRWRPVLVAVVMMLCLSPTSCTTDIVDGGSNGPPVALAAPTGRDGSRASDDELSIALLDAQMFAPDRMRKRPQVITYGDTPPALSTELSVLTILMLEHRDKEIQACRAILKKWPNSEEANLMLARLSAESNGHAEALKYLDWCITRSRSREVVRWCLRMRVRSLKALGLAEGAESTAAVLTQAEQLWKDAGSPKPGKTE